MLGQCSAGEATKCTSDVIAALHAAASGLPQRLRLIPRSASLLWGWQNHRSIWASGSGEDLASIEHADSPRTHFRRIRGISIGRSCTSSWGDAPCLSEACASCLVWPQCSLLNVRGTERAIIQRGSLSARGHALTYLHVPVPLFTPYFFLSGLTSFTSLQYIEK